LAAASRVGEGQGLKLHMQRLKLPSHRRRSTDTPEREAAEFQQPPLTFMTYCCCAPSCADAALACDAIWAGSMLLICLV
jgi:hypothetical protein